MSAAVQYLAFDIQEDILNRMNDVKSLMRFRSISKAWKSHIERPKFIADHHQKQRRHLILVHDDDDVSIIVDNDDDSFPRDQYRLTLPSTLSLQNNNVSFIGSIGSSSDGLLGFYRRYHDGTSSIVIWNPSVVINVLRLPKGDVDIRFGFGVCPGSYDLKLVKLVTSAFQDSITDVLYEDRLMPWQVEVYTLSSGVWRSPLCSQLPRRSILLPYNHSVVVNSIIYWLACLWDEEAVYKDEYAKLIISFDLTTEEFEEIDLPDNLENPFIYLAKRRESLVVIEYCWNRETRECGVWVMNHPNSFTKLYSVIKEVPRAITFLDILEFRKNGDPILETRHSSTVWALEQYDPCSECFIDLGFRSEYSKDPFICYTASSYTETLLLLDHQSADSIILE